MKKFIFALLCICALLLPGFTSNDPEENKAMEVTRAYFAAVNKNDLETILSLSAQKRQDDFWAANDGNGDVFFKTMLLIFKDAQFTITAAEKIDDERMIINVLGRFPDLEYVVSTAWDRVEAKYGKDMSQEEIFAAMPSFIPAILAEKNTYKYMEEPLDIKMLKENGQWKVDESINY